MDIVVSKITPIYLVCERGLIMSVPKRSAGVKIVVDCTLRIIREARSFRLFLVLVC